METFMPSNSTTSNSTTSNALYVPAGKGQLFDLGDHRGYAKVSSKSTDGTFALAEAQVDHQGGGTPP